MKKILLSALVFFGFFQELLAQQLPQYSQYLFNDYAINPAVGGSNPYFDSRINYRNQWTGVTDSPRTFILGVHGPLKSKKVGLGGSLFTDITGPTRRTGFNFSYTYHLKIADNTKLGLGLSAGLLQFAIDGSKITLRDPGDQYFANNVQSVLLPDFGFGFYLYHDKYFLGASVPQLIQNKINFFSNVNSMAKLEEHYFVSGGYKFDIGKDFQFQPSFLMKYVNPIPVQFDFSGRLIYLEKLWLGGTYRTKDAISAMIGFTHQDNMVFGYSYDFTVSGLQKYSAGTHELMIGMKFIPQSIKGTPSVQ